MWRVSEVIGRLPAHVADILTAVGLVVAAWFFFKVAASLLKFILGLVFVLLGLTFVVRLFSGWSG